MEIRQEHVAEDGTVTDSKDEANKLRLDELQEQAQQNTCLNNGQALDPWNARY